MEEKYHELLLRSFDDQLAADQEAELEAALAASPHLRQLKADYLAIRQGLKNAGSKSFEPDFTDRVIAAIGDDDNFLPGFRQAFMLVAACAGLLCFSLMLYNGITAKDLSLSSVLGLDHVIAGPFAGITKLISL